MTIVIAVALVLLGLAIGFILTWTTGIGPSVSLFVGVLLVAAGAIIGFVIEWFIDEAYRRNRELQRQLSGQGSASGSVMASQSASLSDVSDKLAEFLQKRDEELLELRQQLATTDAEMDKLQSEFQAYQRSHPDDLTVIRGIGPVYQWKLHDIGVSTFADLASADPQKLRRMLEVKNWQRVDIESWIEQARDWAQRG